MQEEIFNSNKDIILQRYDYIFCGTGASASLLLMQLHQNNLLKNLNILLIDPDNKNKRDKTYCFWADVNEPISADLNEVISHRWDQVILPENKIQNIYPFQYNHVSSIDVYNQIHQLAFDYNWHKFIGYADEVKADSEGPIVMLNGNVIRASYIFDSRPPEFKPASVRETHMHQSFVGWIIDTEDEIKNPSAFRFMDFQIEQNGFTQFVYVLPFSPNSALVEVTRFGVELLEKETAESILEIYIKKNFGKFSIQEIEVGCIPMSNTAIIDTQWPGIIALGARNYQIKPSTGYAFKNMYYHARLLVEAIEQNQPIETFNKINVDAYKGRFSFYDGLLLDILKTNPEQGKPIFEALLKYVEIKKIFNFLDEKSDVKSDLSIFKQLPWGVFLIAGFKRVVSFPSFRPLVLTLITILLLVIGNHSNLQNCLTYGLMIVGLFAVGIPHGAVDHLLETGTWNRKVAPLFVFKYLFLAACMGILWYAQPTLALVFFLFYSSWHFGQADGKAWQFSKVLSLLWGITILVYILGTHSIETNQILETMGSLYYTMNCPQWLLLLWLPLAIYKKSMSFALTVFWIVISAQLPLILSFGLYFIGQHSLTGWNDIKQHLKINNSQLWLQSLPFHATSWIFLLYFIVGWSMGSPFQFQNHWALFFIFLSCISLPHVICMNAVYRSKKVH